MRLLARPRRARPGSAGAAGALAALLALAALGCGEEPLLPRERPNVVLFMIDTLRADWLRSYGRSEPTSPAMDSLAREGVLFESASAPAPWTLPSVASIFTARFVPGHNVVYDGQKLAPEIPTLAERLAEQGYTTASFYTNVYTGPMSGLDRGFAVAEDAGATVRGARVRRWLEGTAETPFFLYVHNREPHDPYSALPEFVRPFGGVPPGTRKRVAQAYSAYRTLTRVDFEAGRPLGSTDNTEEQRLLLEQLESLEPRVRTLYSATVRQADARVAEVMQALRTTGHWEDTLFIVVSDHGEAFGRHGGWLHDQSLYEELVHVPLLVRFPGDRAAGRRVAQPVSLVDLMPTILEAAQAGPPPEAARGRSLLPLVRGEAPAGGAEPRVVAVRNNRKKYFRPFARRRGDRNVAVREGPWKGILNVEPGTFELYDLSADPGEQRDRSEAEPERARRLRRHAEARLERLEKAGVDSLGGGLESLDDETRDQLEALGYVDERRSGEEGTPEDAPAP